MSNAHMDVQACNSAMSALYPEQGILSMGYATAHHKDGWNFLPGPDQRNSN